MCRTSPTNLPPSCVSASGGDQFGLWCEITLPLLGGDLVSQRFRWIGPGAFFMGSPDDEHDRFGDEGPRHRVTLSQGFWLADTACTQAMWMAVMGEKSHYWRGKSRRELEHPVVNVNWHDVQGFMARLQTLVPDFEAALPTEAQWEYACRAGRDMAFSFGGDVSPEQVNYDGNLPYSGGAAGRYREQTVPVKSLPANEWGLYEMHGNVWEWCSDRRREYSAVDALDPIGLSVVGGSLKSQGKNNAECGQSAGKLAQRGGSWFSGAGRARSAARGGSSPSEYDDHVGFRIALRPTSQGSQGQKRPGSGSAVEIGCESGQLTTRTVLSRSRTARSAWTQRLRNALGLGQDVASPDLRKKHW